LKKKIGDKVILGDILAEIETDKTTMELESFDNGELVNIFIGEGVVVDVGNKLCELKGTLGAYETDATPKHKTKPQQQVKIKTPNKILNGNGLTAKSPYLKSLESVLCKQPVSVEKVSVGEFSEGTSIKFSSNDRFISNKMVLTKKQVPHFYLEVCVDITKMLLLKKDLSSYSLTVNDFLLKATALALADCPKINSSWVDQTFYYEYSKVNLGFAVNTENDEVLVPVIKNCNSKSILEVSLEAKDLIKKARRGFVIQNSKPTFTLTNLGMYGIQNFFGIINLPNSGILSVGASYKKIKVPSLLEKNNVKPLEFSDNVNLSFSGDHRVLNGVKAAVFLNKLKYYLEKPLTLLL
jgi:pyruvate dehydrogenase E2 component (dihydrolipoamide acetyltransferase)